MDAEEEAYDLPPRRVREKEDPTCFFFPPLPLSDGFLPASQILVTTGIELFGASGACLSIRGAEEAGGGVERPDSFSGTSAPLRGQRVALCHYHFVNKIINLPMPRFYAQRGTWSGE